MLRGRFYKKSPSNSQNSSDTRTSPLSRGRKLIRAIPLHKPSRLQPNKIPDPNVLSESPTGFLTKCGSNQLSILCHFPYLCMHERRRHIDLESHQRDLQLEVRRERYSRLKLLFQNLQILFKVDFDQGFEGLRLSSFERVLGFIKVKLQGAQEDHEAEVFQVSNVDTTVAQRRLEDKQPEEKTNTDSLVKEQEKVHLGIKHGANITVTGVPDQEGGLRFEVPAFDGDVGYRLCLSAGPKMATKGNLREVVTTCERGLGFKPRRGGFPSGAKKEWSLSPKAKVRVLHTAQLDVTVSSNH
uniref:Zinc finger, CCHC-type n=1 Tax=Tanacetum cinerariifolium TaxID=118510 RepID=A0A699IBG6_TANCI|nr:zinc finger, CCHC-type [Tanacetum cinerariifolium]